MVSLNAGELQRNFLQEEFLFFCELSVVELKGSYLRGLSSPLRKKQHRVSEIR